MQQTSYGTLTITDTTDIARVQNWYLASSSSSGVQKTDSGWTTDVTNTNATMTATKQYLWNYEQIQGEGANGSYITISTTDPVIIGRYGQNGGAGRGIASIVEHYLATSVSSGVTTSTSGWTPEVQATTSTNRYLWNYETITWTSGTPLTTDTEPRIIGTHGVDGRTYIIEFSNTVIKKDANNAFSPTTVTIKTYYRDGTGAKTAYSGRMVITGNTSEGSTVSITTVNNSTYTLTPNTAYVSYTINLYATGGTTNLLAVETLPILSDVENLEIGGRNLLRNSKTMETWYEGDDVTIYNDIATFYGSSSGWSAQLSTDKFDASLYDGYTQYIVSFEYNLDIDCDVLLTINGSSASVANLYKWPRTKYANWTPTITLTKTNGEWKKYSFPARTISTANLTSGSGAINSGYLAIYSRTDDTKLQIRNVKFEKGNKATDWSSAPEDGVIGDNLIKNSDFNIFTANATYTSVSFLHWNLGADVDLEYVEEGQIGALVLNSGGTSDWRIYQPCKPDTTTIYAYSFYAHCDTSSESNTIAVSLGGNSGESHSVSGLHWQYCSGLINYTTSADNDVFELRFVNDTASMYIKNVKLEVGTIPTKWIQYKDDPVDSLDNSLTQESVFNRLTNNGEAQGLYIDNGDVYINATYIKSGTLTLGGAQNGNGLLQVRNSNNELIGSWDNTGIYAKGKIVAETGSIGGFNISNTDDRNKTTAQGGHAYPNSLYKTVTNGTYDYEVGMKATSGVADLAFYVKRINTGSTWMSDIENIFWVNNRGKLYASDAEIGGTIRSNNGLIAGFTLSSDDNKGTSAEGGHCHPLSMYKHITYDGYEYEVGLGSDFTATDDLDDGVALYVYRINENDAWSNKKEIFSLDYYGAMVLDDVASGAKLTFSGSTLQTQWQTHSTHIDMNARPYTAGMAYSSIEISAPNNDVRLYGGRAVHMTAGTNQKGIHIDYNGGLTCDVPYCMVKTVVTTITIPAPSSSNSSTSWNVSGITPTTYTGYTPIGVVGAYTNHNQACTLGSFRMALGSGTLQASGRNTSTSVTSLEVTWYVLYIYTNIAW